MFQVEAGTSEGALDRGANTYAVPDLDFGFRTLTAGIEVAVPADGVTVGVLPEVVPTGGVGDLTTVPGLATCGGATGLNAVTVLSRSLGSLLSGDAEAAAFPALDGGGGPPAFVGAGLATLLSDV